MDVKLNFASSLFYQTNPKVDYNLLERICSCKSSWYLMQDLIRSRIRFPVLKSSASWRWIYLFIHALIKGLFTLFEGWMNICASDVQWVVFLVISKLDLHHTFMRKGLEGSVNQSNQIPVSAKNWQNTSYGHFKI